MMLCLGNPGLETPRTLVPNVLILYLAVSDLKSSDETSDRSSTEASRPVPRPCDMGHAPFRGSSLSALCIACMTSYSPSLPGFLEMNLPKAPSVKQQGTDFRIQEWSTALLTHCSERQTSTGPAVLMCSGVPIKAEEQNVFRGILMGSLSSHGCFLLFRRQNI